MRNLVALVVAATALFGVATPTAHAQRGVGAPSGVASQPVKPEIVSLSGTIVEVDTGPCEATTGRSLAGTHLILENAQKEQLNIHLGPADAVAGTVAKLSAGQAISAKAFRTEKMKANHFVAQSLTFGETTVTLRDAGLRPVWAWGNLGPRGPMVGPVPPGRGRGPGWGRGGRRWQAPPQRESAVVQERVGKIAVTATGPTLDATVDPQFGRCPYFLLVDTDEDTFEALKNTSTTSGNAGVQAGELIASKGVKVLLTGQCGPTASKALAAAGIRIVPGCSGTVRAAVEQFKAGQSQPENQPKKDSEPASSKTSPSRKAAQK